MGKSLEGGQLWVAGTTFSGLGDQLPRPINHLTGDLELYSNFTKHLLKSHLLPFFVVALFAPLSCGFAAETNPIASGGIQEPSGIAVPRLTPKPLVVAGVANPVLDLSGKWRFAYNLTPDAWRGDVDFKTWREISVPGQWTSQGFWLQEDNALRAIYTRTVDIPKDWTGQRIKLRFDGFVGPAWIFINGEQVGVREGFLRKPQGQEHFARQWGTSFTPFEWDVTQYCKPGGENRIVAVMARAYDLYDHTDAGGLLRPLRLIAVPPLNLSSFHVSTELDEAYRDAVFKAEFELSNEGGSAGKNLSVLARVREVGKDGKVIAEKAVDVPALAAGASQRQVIEIPISNPNKWDPEHPNLYMAEGVLLENGKQLMSSERRFGFREVEVRGTELLVNGVSVKVRGSNRHETHPILGRSLTDELYKKDAEAYRALNVNFIRTSHYPPDERFIDACDELGLMVEVEAPMWGWHWGDGNLAVPLDDEKAKLMMRSTLEMVQRDRSHPSVVLWSLANECNWNQYFAANREAVKALDPTRPTIFSNNFLKKEVFDQDLNEFAAMHYPPPEEVHNMVIQMTRPVLFGEYAHLNCYNKQELGYDPGLRSLWGPDFVKEWEGIYKSKIIVGGTIWCGQDSVFFLETSGNLGSIEQNTGLDQTFAKTVVNEPGAKIFSTGCGPWGIFDAWMREKPEHLYVKAAYSPIQLPSTAIALDPKSDTLQIPVENRNHFRNLSDFRFEWTAGDRKGGGRADVAAQAKGTLTLTGLKGLAKNQSIDLRAFSPLGFEVNRWILKKADSASESPADFPVSANVRLEVSETATDFVVTAGPVSYRIDKSGANPLRIEREGVPVVTGGPHLMLSQAIKDGDFAGHEPNVPATEACSNWAPGKLELKKNSSNVVVTVPGSYDQASGQFLITIKQDGTFDVAHDFTVKSELGVLQTGVVLDLPRSMDHLFWKRDATLSFYPGDHIGRPEGDAPAFFPGVALSGVFGPLSKPNYPWSHDGTKRGSNDFRSTKYNVRSASLRDKNGAGLYVKSNGDQHIRAWVLDKKIRLLVADYSGYGSERHCKYGAPKTMKPGQRVSGKAVFGTLSPLYETTPNANPPAKKTATRYEAEDGELAGGSFAKGIFVEALHYNDASCTFLVDGGSGGMHEMVVTYATPLEGSALKVIVNGEEKTLDLPATGSWYDGTDQIVTTVKLQPRQKNRIEFRNMQQGSANLDYIELRPVK